MPETVKQSEAEFWQAIKQKVGKTVFETWFSPLRIKFSPETVILVVPDKFFQDWIETHYLDVVKEALEKSGNASQVNFEINPSVLQKTAQKTFRRISAKFQEEASDSIKLNPRFNFGNFVVGPSNRMAHAASLAVAENPGKVYNPLFIYGEVGLGKTHLMQAIAHYTLKKRGAKIKYLSSEKFTNELINAIRNRSTDRFRQKYRNTDMLLIDDVQFIGGKESTQEEFFHTFNALYDNHKQIVISSDRPPRVIPNLEKRLVSRFSWGLVVDVQPPDFETRMAILRKKIESEPIKVDNEVISFIAKNINTNIRELEGALIRVIAYSLIDNRPIDIDMAKEILKDMVREQDKKIDASKIFQRVAEYFNLEAEDLKGKKRSKSFVLPKQIAMYLFRELTDYSLPEIGKIFGTKHHTTILYAHRKLKEILRKDSKVNNIVSEITQKLKL